MSRWIQTEDAARGTGRTTRMVAAAAEASHEYGARVTVVGATKNDCRLLSRMLVDAKANMNNITLVNHSDLSTYTLPTKHEFRDHAAVDLWEDHYIEQILSSIARLRDLGGEQG